MTDQKKSLMDIAKDAYDFEQRIIEAGGEISEALEAELVNINKDLTTKVDAYFWRMNQLEGRAEVYKKQATMILSIATSLNRVVEEMEERIKQAMITMKVPEVRGDTAKFKLTDTAGKLIIEDEKLIPMAFKTIVPESYVPDRKRIKDALTKGEQVSGVRLEPGFGLRKYAAANK